MRKKPKILFLDDNKNRCSKYQSKYPHATIINTVDECINALTNEPEWHTVSLDHDLGGDIFVDSIDPNCGMEVVRYLEEFGETMAIGRIIIHSFNELAANEMVERLKICGYNAAWLPFDSGQKEAN